jgi:ABC-type glycerol-3-phosphate transport system substrate-binding protein
MEQIIHVQLIGVGESKKDYVNSVEAILREEPVRVTCIEWADAFRKIQSMEVSDSNSPDILQVGKTWIPYFVKMKKFVDLTNIMSLPVKTPGNCSSYSLNYFYDPVLLYFRKDFIGRQNLLTRESFINSCQRLKNKQRTKHVLGLIAHREWYLLHVFFSFLWGFGGEICIDQFSYKLNYDEHFVKTLEFYEMLLREYANPDEQLSLYPVSFPTMTDFFVNRKDFSLFIGGSWIIRDLQKIYGNLWGAHFGVTALPTANTTNHPVFIGGSDLCVFNKKPLKNVDIIKRCLKKLNKSSNQLRFCMATGNIPANAHARREWASILDRTYQTEFYDFLEKIISNGRLYPTNPRWDEVGNGILSALPEIFNNLFGGFSGNYSDSNSKQKMIFDTLTKHGIDPKYEYDICLSFARENRNIASKLARLLKKKNVRIFLDEWETSRLIGLNLVEEFQRIYGGKSRLAIVLISKYYPVKYWTKFEFKIIEHEAERRNKIYIIPCIVEDVEEDLIPNPLRTTGWIDLRIQPISEAVQIIMNKLQTL